MKSKRDKLTTPCVSPEEADALSEKFSKSTPEEILEWAVSRFGDGLGMMTALGYSGIVLMDIMRKMDMPLEPYFIDTGFHFPETLELMRGIERDWHVKFNILKPSMTEAGLLAEMGPQPWKSNPDLCCHHMKIEPLLRVLHEKRAWLSALRRDQSASRERIGVVEVDGRGAVKIYPLAKWSRSRTWGYVKSMKLPYNPLHDRGYPSVGCVHCTQPVKDGAPERSGRWNSMPKLECGIHYHRRHKSEN